MKCTNKKIAELLPWYITDNLSNENKEKVKKHLSNCPKCEADLIEIRKLANSLKENKEDLFSEHVLPEQLVLYAEAKHELNKNDLSQIENHLQFCSDCKRELMLLDKVNQSLNPPQEFSAFEKVAQKLSDIFSILINRPALAYILILLLLYPAYLGIFKSEKTLAPSIAQRNYELIQFNTRAEVTKENEINISSQTEVFSLSFNIPILTNENIRYDANIFDAHKKLVWQKNDIKSMDEYGTFLLICYREFFIEGTYSLIIDEFNLTNNQVQNDFVFSFKVVKN